jgi:hypothetical protein
LVSKKGTAAPSSRAMTASAMKTAAAIGAVP